MNQILQVETKKKNKQRKNTGNKLEINSIIRVFSVILIVFGLILIATSSYGMITGQTKMRDDPNVAIDKIGNEAVVKISTTMPISKFVYNWNSKDDVDVPLNGTVSVEHRITIPRGNNILNLKITDYYGNEKQFQKQYIYESNDMEKPTIELSVVGNNIKITAKDETQILYMTYKWNNGQETRIDATREDQTEIVETIPVEKGENKLTVTVSDTSDNIQTKEQQIKGVNKPTVSVLQDGEYLIMKISDEVGVKNFKYVLNGEEYTTGDADLDLKEFEYKQQLKQGDNHIIITVTNMSDVETVFEGVCTY